MWSLGVKLDGIDPQKEWGLIFLIDHYHPATPEIRNKSLAIPGMFGEWDFGSEWGKRSFSLPFGIIKKDKQELQRNIRAFVAFLLDSYGRPREIQLIFDYEPDKYYMVKLNGRIDPDRVIRTGRFDLSLIAHKPSAAKLTAADQIYFHSEDVDFNNTVPFFEGINETITFPKEIKILNEGTTVIRPDFFIEGSGTGIKFHMNGKTFSVGTLSNNTIDIVGESFTVKKDGITSLSAIIGDFLELFPGDNTLSILGTNLNFDVMIIPKPKFI